MARTKIATKKTTKKAAAAKSSTRTRRPKKAKRTRRARREKTLVEKVRGAVYSGYKTVRDHSATPVVAGALAAAVTSVGATALYFKRFV